MDLAFKIKKNLAILLPKLESALLARCSAGEIETIAGHVADHLGQNPSQPMAVFARTFLERARSGPNRFSENGEKWLLDRLKHLDFNIFFDVGANVGVWSTHVLAVFEAAELHAFEIVPTTFDILRSRLPKANRIHLNAFGLGDKEGEVTVNLNASSNLLSSIFALQEAAKEFDTIKAKVRRGANYAEDHGISRIDFLKIDVEGAEGLVLEGFAPLFDKRRVRLIQFEYNRGAILSNFLLKNAYEFFAPRGYQLGKLTQHGVYFHKYHFSNEDFSGPNYIACLEDDQTLIDLIQAKKAP